MATSAVNAALLFLGPGFTMSVRCNRLSRQLNNHMDRNLDRRFNQFGGAGSQGTLGHRDRYLKALREVQRSNIREDQRRHKGIQEAAPPEHHRVGQDLCLQLNQPGQLAPPYLHLQSYSSQHLGAIRHPNQRALASLDSPPGLIHHAGQLGLRDLGLNNLNGINIERVRLPHQWQLPSPSNTLKPPPFFPPAASGYGTANPPQAATAAGSYTAGSYAPVAPQWIPHYDEDATQEDIP
ncbi:hypothetical protein B0T22DRAFT_445211 [Podospora appendiculata]|uniref:Uncharacterized protein n=1 Tax=Podospora appendiculata TaxID=314037 RepID=A0AAE0WZU0_9PEZI|nr:hypothetical protein B0T22DRAFT_445211 [Podospora appendiculata]